jgi:hypothetical protein
VNQSEEEASEDGKCGVNVRVTASGSARAVGGNMCRSVCVGVLERVIGSFEMQLSRSTSNV